MKFTLVLAATAPLAAVTFAATITLFEGLPTTTQLPILSLPSFSPTLHAIGTGSDGMTTYVEEYVISVVVQEVPIQRGSNGVFNPSTTFGTSFLTTTITPGPTTVSYTFAEDATHFIYHQEPEPSGNTPVPFGEDNDCVFDGKSSETCVDRVEIGSTTTITRTFSAPATTFHTTIAAETKDNGAVPGSVRESCIAWGILGIGAVSAWVLLL